ncbi:MAG: hypothetical protein ABR548_01735 [Actinomycetota bacterium]|nr:hypothetical protein [Actinomycetota bacterium]
MPQTFGGRLHIHRALIAIFVVAAACGTQPSVTRATPSATPTPTGPVLADPYEGWNSYTSPWEGMAFRYPGDWNAETKALDLGSRRQSGDRLQLTSPNGFTLTWTAPLSGIGGGCDEKRDPHVFVDRVLPLDVQGSRNPLRVIVATVEQHKSLAVVDATAFRKDSFETGDTGECLFYPIFRSKEHTTEALVQLMSGEGVQLGNGAQSSDGSERLSVDQYLALPDVDVAVKIFKSLRY